MINSDYLITWCRWLPLPLPNRFSSLHKCWKSTDSTSKTYNLQTAASLLPLPFPSTHALILPVGLWVRGTHGQWQSVCHTQFTLASLPLCSEAWLAAVAYKPLNTHTHTRPWSSSREGEAREAEFLLTGVVNKECGL